MSEVDPRGGQRRRIGHVGRRDPHAAPAGAGQAGKGRQDEAQLADARLIGQELGDPLPRPAAAGELGVQRRKAGPYC